MARRWLPPDPPSVLLSGVASARAAPAVGLRRHD